MVALSEEAHEFPSPVRRTERRGAQVEEEKKKF